MAYLDDISQVWHLVRETFRPELSDIITDLWLGGLEVLDFQGSTVVMKAESEVKIRVVTSKYKTEIEKRFSEMLGFDVSLRLVCTASPQLPTEDNGFFQRMPEQRVSEPSQALASPAPAAEPAPAAPVQNQDNAFTPGGIGSTLPPFNFEYTFENFIVGSSNKFAHAACLAVAAPKTNTRARTPCSPTPRRGSPSARTRSLPFFQTNTAAADASGSRLSGNGR